MKIHGSHDLGARLHQWHSGMDAVYAVGSQFYAGRAADAERVEAALAILDGIYARRKDTRMPAKDAKHLRDLRADLRALLRGGDAPRSNPAKLPRRVEGLVRMGVPVAKAKSLHAEMRKVEGYDVGGRDSLNAVDAILAEVDSAVGGHGVESTEGDWVDRYYQNIVLLYVNMGDTYTTTLAFDTNTTRFYVTSWGDWVERNGDKRGVQ